MEKEGARVREEGSRREELGMVGVRVEDLREFEEDKEMD